jgi:hypothetical protein
MSPLVLTCGVWREERQWEKVPGGEEDVSGGGEEGTVKEFDRRRGG